MINETCVHNERTRYTHGYYCRNCATFFDKGSPTYRSGELLSSIWCVLNNINVDLFRSGKEKDSEVSDMMDEIGIGIIHKNYEHVIAKAEAIMSKYQKNSNSAKITLS